MSPWREHRGGDCPTHPQAEVICRYASGYEGKPLKAGGLRWSHTGEPFDIAFYQVVNIPDEVRE